jgi:hypothetical protein
MKNKPESNQWSVISSLRTASHWRSGRSELNGHRLADRFERLEVELNADGDFLVNQVLGYSP